MRLALTIDVEARDHPCENGNFRAMVDVLGDAGAPATLFVQGGWVEHRATDDEIMGLVAEGMVVGLHGHTHRRFTELTGDEIDDIESRRRAGADCAIVLFHSWPDPTPEAIRIVLEYAHSQNDELVAVVDLARRDWNAPVVLQSRPT